MATLKRETFLSPPISNTQTTMYETSSSQMKRKYYKPKKKTKPTRIHTNKTNGDISKKETAIVTVTGDLITFNHMRKKAQTTKKNQTTQRKFGIKKNSKIPFGSTN